MLILGTGPFEWMVFGVMFALISACMGYVGVKSMTDNKVLQIVGCVLGFLLTVPGIIIAIFICYFTGNTEKSGRYSKYDQSFFGDPIDPDEDDDIAPQRRDMMQGSVNVHQTSETASGSHSHEERRIYVEDLDKEVKNGILSSSASSDKLYNQYCGHDDKERKYVYEQQDQRAYLDSEKAELSPQAKKEYVESLKNKLDMGMISKEEYKKLIKRYR